MSRVEQKVKPYRIVIEWTENSDFFFSCDHKSSGCAKKGDEKKTVDTHWFPHVTRAMGNVLKKLRREHITFPLFLISLAFEHRHLLKEIEDLLKALHNHLGSQQGAGCYTCFISGENRDQT